MSVTLVKKTGTGELLSTTPAEVAEVVYENNDIEILTTELLEKLESLTPSVFLTQAEYDAIPTPDPDIEYKIRPAL